MKVVFVNPPHIRSKNSSSENDFKIDGFVFKSVYKKIPGANTIFALLHKFFGLGKNVRYGVRAGSRWPWTCPIPHGGPPYPFFMGYAAAYLQSHGIEVNILDAIVEEKYDYQKFLQEVKDEKADIVVLECSTPTIDIDLWFADKVAEFAVVALAGPHLNNQTVGEIQEQHPQISYFLPGEYTLSILESVQTKTPGVYLPKVVEDLDSVPFPHRDYDGAKKYYDPTMPTPKPQLQIYGSKGCPFKCTFCAWPQTMYFGKVSLRNSKSIAGEIREAIAKDGFKSIFFDDDTFNLGTERISELCDYLKEIGLPWTMMGRLDASPNWLYDKMVDSGCVGMRFGIETFNLDVLKRVRKGIERVDFKKTLEYISNKYSKLMIHITMMRDMPGQSIEDHENDMKIIREMGYNNHGILRTYQVSKCAPFPGTQLYEEMKKELGEESLKNYQKYDGGQDTVMKKQKVDKK